MNCEYNFTMEWYGTMSKACYDCPHNKSDCGRQDCIAADGFERSVVVVNRKLPGETLSVCEGDTVVVRVKNHLANGEGTSIHWHGLYQRESPWMDGVPMVTQCPIPAMTTHQYQFKAEPAGTHWWHAHAGFHRGDGAAGPLVVRKPQEHHRKLYDHDLNEHVIFIGDWLHQSTMDKFVMHHHSDKNNKGEGMLINGRGMFTNFTDEFNNTITTPLSEFEVNSTKRYRFRAISNAVVFCPMEISVDNHNLTVIASDGKDIEPEIVSTLTLHGGERYDFVLNADQPIASYWLRVQGVADCVNQSQLAVVKYRGSASDEKPTSNKTESHANLNPLYQTAANNPIHVRNLRSVEKVDPRLSQDPDQVLYFGFDFKQVDNEVFHRPDFYPITAVPRDHHLYTPQINNVTFMAPDRPLLYQGGSFDEGKICDPAEEGYFPEATGEFRSCVHRVKVEFNKTVEMVIFDEGFTFNAGHPMHLHGQHFAVVAMNRTGTNLTLDQMKELRASGKIEYELERPPIKDTVIIPDGGYTIVRFVSDNPGYWAFHCHLSFHVETGMMLVIQVGEDDQMKKVPEDYPRCGSYLPGPTIKSNNNGNSSAYKPFSSYIHFVLCFLCFCFR